MVGRGVAERESVLTGVWLGVRSDMRSDCGGAYRVLHACARTAAVGCCLRIPAVATAGMRAQQLPPAGRRSVRNGVGESAAADALSQWGGRLRRGGRAVCGAACPMAAASSGSRPDAACGPLECARGLP